MTQVAQGSSDAAELAVAQAAQGGGAVRSRKPLAELVEKNLDEITRALPPGIMDADRFARIVLTEFRRNEKLLVCTPTSFLGALFQVAQLGLEPGGSLGHAFLIPYDNNKLGVTECQLQVGYKGYVELAGRRGIMLRAREVHAHDDFAFDLGSNEYLHHTWKMGEPRGDVIGFYGKVVYPDGKVSFHVMELEEINKRRDRSSAVQASKRNSWMKTPWDTDYDAMARKTVIRSMVPQIALAPELQTALRADEAVVERGAHGDLSYAYRDAIDIGQVSPAGPSKDDVTQALNDMEDNHQRVACSKYLLDNFGPIAEVSDHAAAAMLKVVQEWPAVLQRDVVATTAKVATKDLGTETTTILDELDDALRAQAVAHIEAWLTGNGGATDEATALELERWLNSDPEQPETAAQAPQEPAEAPVGDDGAPEPADPQGAPPGGVSDEALSRVQAGIEGWDIATVKTKLKEFGQSAQGAEKACRTRLLMTLAPLYAAGEPAVTALF